MEKNIVNAKEAAPPIGPYSHAVRVGQFLFTSGQVPLDVNGNKVDGDITAQTQQVFANLKAVLAQAGLGFQDVVKTTVFMKDLGDFAAMNAVYATYFTENPPARSTVQVAALPKDSLVEIEVVAVAQ